MKIAHFCAVLALACTALFVSAAPAPAAEPASAEWHAPTHPICVSPAGLERPCAGETAELTAYQPDGQVDIDIGKILGAIFGAMGAAIAAWVSAIVTRVAGNWLEAKDAARLAEYSARAIAAAMNYVPEATAGKKVSFKIGSELVERALEQGLSLFPNLIEAFGGAEAQRRRLWSYVDLAEGEAVPGVTPVALQPLPKAPPVAPITQ